MLFSRHENGHAEPNLFPIYTPQCICFRPDFISQRHRQRNGVLGPSRISGLARRRAAQLGIIEGIAESVASFAKLFSGYVTDRVPHRKPIVVGGYFVANAVKPLLALVSSWWQILGIRFSDRFAKGVRGTARDVMVAESVDKSALGSAYGLIQAMDSAGAIAGPLLALAVIGRFGMRGVFASAAIPGALCVLVAW